MVRKFVGKILPNIMELTKGDMDKKQDKMDALTAEDMKDIWPPFSVKEELSKSAPIQITLLDAEDQPLVGQSFTIKKSNSLLTSGKTNNSGLCVYNEPEVMTCDILPCSLEYADQNVEIQPISYASYMSLNVKNTTDAISLEVTKTDGANPAYVLAPEGSIDDYEYETPDYYETPTVVLNKYIGTNKDVIVYDKYLLNGVEYTTCATNSIFQNNTMIESVKFGYDAGRSLGTNIDYLFSGCSSLKDVDLSTIVANGRSGYPVRMNSMFSGCSSLKTVDLSVMKITYLGSTYMMFRDCTLLEYIDFTGIDMSNVTEMGQMFMDCTNLKTIKGIEDFNLNISGNVIDATSMFSGCSSLVSLDLNKWDVRGLSEVTGMFSMCSSLKELKIGKWDTSNYFSDLSRMFSGCSSLESIDINDWDVSNVNKLENIFFMCSSLKLIDLSKWNLSKVNAFRYEFQKCTALEVINLNNVDTSNTTVMYLTFADTPNLKSVNVSRDKWVISDGCICLDIFKNSKINEVTYVS